MILYNVTVKVNTEAHDEWLQWMKDIHIPEVMQTGFFTEYKLCRILDQDENDGITYAIQYLCRNMEDYETYKSKFAPALQQAHSEKFKDQFVAFRTIMDVTSHS